MAQGCQDLPKPNEPNPEAMFDVEEAAGQGEEEAAGKEGCPKGGATVAAAEEA